MAAGGLGFEGSRRDVRKYNMDRANVANAAQVKNHVLFSAPITGQFSFPSRGLQTAPPGASTWAAHGGPPTGARGGTTFGPERARRIGFRFPSQIVRDKKSSRKLDARNDQIPVPVRVRIWNALPFWRRGLPFRVWETVREWAVMSASAAR